MSHFRLFGATLLAAVLLYASPAPAGAQSRSTVHRVPTPLMLLRMSRDPTLRAVLMPWLLRGQQSPPSAAAVLNPFAWPENVLYTFGGADGNEPNELVAAGGALYGTTYGGGAYGMGTVFKLTPPAPGQAVWSESVLYSFAGNTAAAALDGSYPQAGLFVDQFGALYGTTTAGGSVACFGFGCGTVFKVTPPTAGKTAWTESILHAFTGSDGSDPQAALIAYDGALFGTAVYGGTLDKGVAFELWPPAAGQTVWTENVIHSFGADGSYPGAALIENGGALYSTTMFGGSSIQGGFGTVFKLVPPIAGQTAWAESVIHAFTDFDGAVPLDPLIKDAHGALYGTALRGGYGGCTYGYCGTVFKLTPTRGSAAWTYDVLHYFTASEGNQPGSALTADPQGNLYGMNSNGGAYGNGNVFELLAPAPGKHTYKEVVLHTFTGGSDGAYPYDDNLVRDAHGALYGATEFSAGDACQCGVVFKLVR